MLGHKLWQVLSQHFDTYATFRQSLDSQPASKIYDPSRIITGVSVQDFDSFTRAIANLRPAVVVNCIGIVKQDTAAKDPLISITINALFPHRLAQLCRASGSRLIHISTDCVFTGRKGNYHETDVSDAEDLYGRTKLLGEVSGDNCLTMRTSIIGRELAGAHGLLEWFLSQQGKTVEGFKRAIFSGFTTLALSEIIAHIIAEHRDLNGLWHVASQPISKFDLLSVIREIYGLNIEIRPNKTFACDRSLNGERFRRAINYVPPSWPEMIERMRNDSTPYVELRRTNVN